MSYTPPSGTQIDASWEGALAHSAPIGTQIDAQAGDLGVYVRAVAASPLGAASVLAGVQGFGGWASVASPLAAPALLAEHVQHAIRVSAPSILSSPSIAAWHDFAGQLGDVISHYVMDLDTPAGQVRVPVSSWQATLQAGLSNYVQCVIPAASPFVSALETATAFTVRRRAVAPSGVAIEYPMATAPAQTVRFDRGPQRNTCTLSGYTAASAPIGTDPPPAVYDRELVGVRSISSGAGGVRVRCAIDWTLRPGHRAFVDGAPFVVSYINYYVTGGEAYADVGERA